MENSDNLVILLIVCCISIPLVVYAYLNDPMEIENREAKRHRHKLISSGAIDKHGKIKSWFSEGRYRDDIESGLFIKDDTIPSALDRYKKAEAEFDFIDISGNIVKLLGPSPAYHQDTHVHYQFLTDFFEEINILAKEEQFEEAKIKLSDMMTKYKNNALLLRAKHPQQISINVPEINESTGPVEIESESMFAEKDPYLVDAKARTCTCSEFTSFGSLNAITDIRRVCRHQIKVMRKNGTLPQLSFYANLVCSHPFRDHYYSLIQGEKSKYLIGYTSPLEWISIWILNSKDPTERYSFNMLEKRWSYGASPRGYAAEIRPALRIAFNLE